MQISVMGKAGIGKSALVIRFVTDDFVENYDPTIEDTWHKDVEVDGKTDRLDIVDTAGEEVFIESMFAENWVKPADGFLLMYDITDKETFTGIVKTKQEVVTCKESCDGWEGMIPIVLVGNKYDLEESRRVTPDEGKNLAEEWGVPFFETSAKTKRNVDAAMQACVRECRKRNEPEATQATKPKKKFCNIL